MLKKTSTDMQINTRQIIHGNSVWNKTAWMYVDLEQSHLQLSEHRINRVSSYTYLGCSVNDKGLSDDAQDVISWRPNGSWWCSGQFEDRKYFWLKLEQNSLKNSFSLFFFYGLPIFVYRKTDNNKLKAVQDSWADDAAFVEKTKNE